MISSSYWSLFRRKHQRIKYLIFIITVGVGIIIASLVICLQNYTAYFLYSIPSLLVLRGRFLQIMVYIDHIVMYMEMLNLKLKSVVNCKIRKEHIHLDLNYDAIESLEYLLQLKNIYNEIYELVIHFNEFCGWSMFSLFTINFVDIIVNVYWIFMTIVDLYPFSMIYFTTSLVMPLIVIVVMICYSGEYCKREHLNTMKFVQRLLCTSCYDNTTKAYNNLVAEFCTQIKQDPLLITPKEFFTIDLQLLMQIFAAVVSYVVILMQFQTLKNEAQN
ncbi:putative gustatory receptor 39b [Teleopsis dalmanni]|uniref:putative gustatory receptor 39b n=1 Tax=Teleopsis dalmanni TaxID=139649 RepID=UPI0018CD79B7|nr:putative gustatory receptor 39b [Teleopsis dalmanni]